MCTYFWFFTLISTMSKHNVLDPVPIYIGHAQYTKDSPFWHKMVSPCTVVCINHPVSMT